MKNQRRPEQEVDEFDMMMDQNQLEFVEVALAPEESEIAMSGALRPFHFMRLIQQSIFSGAFVTKTLYVHKFAWQQPRCSIPMIDQKLHSYEELRKEIQKVNILKRNNQISKDLKQVDQLLIWCLNIKKTFSFILAQRANPSDHYDGESGSLISNIAGSFGKIKERLTAGVQKLA